MFNNTEKEKRYFIFNINSSKITGALVYFNNKKNIPVIEYLSDTDIFTDNKMSADNFKNKSKEALEKVVRALENYVHISGGVSGIDKAFVFLSPPWIRKNIHNLVDERIEKFTATDKYLETFLENGGQIKEDEDLVKAEIISVKANNYNVNLTEIVDKEILKIDISLLDSYIKRDDKKFISEIITKTFTFVDITYSAFLPTLFFQVKKIYDISGDFAFMDFTGEVMEFGIFMNGQIKDIITIQAGKNIIIKDLVANKIADDFSAAKYLFSLFLSEQLNKEDSRKIDKIVKKHILNIELELTKELEKFKNVHPPRKLFVLSAGPMNYILRDMSIFKEKYFIGKSLLKKFVETDDEKYFDNFVALEAEYIFED